MHPILNYLYDSLSESFGTPARVIKMLAKHPDIRVRIEEPAPVIAAGSVMQWHYWGKHSPGHWPRRPLGRIMGWKHEGGSYRSFEEHRPELEKFGLEDVTAQWTCDIQDLAGFSSSKSTLTDFTSTDDMVETNSPEMIDEITEEKLLKNLAHGEIRILHQKDTTTDHFARFLWDGRMFLMNDGGSHHLAAARYIASRLKRPVSLSAKLYTYSINPEAVNTLRSDFDLYLMSSKPEIFNDFHDAMESFEATYLLHQLPRPYSDDTHVILLPRNEPRSARVSKELGKAGLFDLGQHFGDLCARQRAAA